jgi:two-component system response regulator HydG
MQDKIKVLVVDDDRRMVKTICDILKVKGLEATPAYTGEEAIEWVKSGNPDCVLMDIKMPGIGGIEALTKIKDLSPDLPVIIMSAYATEEQVAEVKKQGAYSLLNKPVDIQMILSFLSLLRKEQTVLIVDDDLPFCRTIKDILQSRGYVVDTESDPAKVLGRMEQDYKLAVVLDLKLGNADGLDVLSAVRARYPTKPVVLVTGHRETMKDSINKGLNIGAYTYLYKPFAGDEIIKVIEEIGKKKMQAVLGELFTAPEGG